MDGFVGKSLGGFSGGTIASGANLLENPQLLVRQEDISPPSWVTRHPVLIPLCTWPFCATTGEPERALPRPGVPGEGGLPRPAAGAAPRPRSRPPCASAAPESHVLPTPALRRQHAPPPAPSPQMQGPAFNGAGQKWTMASIMAAVNSKVVYRTAGLVPDLYGPRGKFVYHETTLVPNMAAAVLGSALLGTFFGLFSVNPVRWLMFKVRGSCPAALLRQPPCCAALRIASASTWLPGGALSAH